MGGVIIRDTTTGVWGDWRFLLPVVAVAAGIMMVLFAYCKQITVIADGDVHKKYTFKSTVEDVLEQVNITLDQDDEVTPELKTALRDGQVITVIRVHKEQFIVEEEIPFEVVRQGDDWLPLGQDKIKQEGITGIKKLVFQRIYRDGIEASSDLVKSEIIRQPQEKIISVGKRSSVIPVISRSSDGSRPGAAGTFMAEATAYTFTGYNTATGIAPYRGVIAVDPRVIPLGTRLYVEGYGEGVALDTGGSIKGNRIDVFFTTRDEAIKWGRRSVKVHILDN